MLKIKLACIILFLFVINIACNSQPGNQSKSDLIACREDTVLVEQKLEQFAPDSKLSTGELLVKIGNSFQGTPYVSHTLETGEDEKLVVNLRELDCTTFDETVLALTLTLKSGKNDFDTYAKQLEQIRYRNGQREGYLSRLHYFTDWLHNNEKKGTIIPLDSSFQAPWQKTINFMSTHSNSYEVLNNNPELVPQIARQESAISKRKMYFIPKEELQANEKQLQNGDIVGITTSIAGLDIAHVGFVIWVNDRVHLLHASSALEKVVISDEPLSDYLAGKKSFTGIMVARPN